METKKGNLATNPQATPSNQKTSKNQSKKRGKRGFSLVELVVMIAMMAVLMAILVPSLLPYVERSRARRDDLAMNEVTNAVLLAMTEPDAYDELAKASLPENVSCYIDAKYESEHSELITRQAVRTGAYNQYIFDDQARILDEKQYYAAGNMHGVTITFKPAIIMNKTKYVLADGVINQFVSNKSQKLSEFPCLYACIRQVVGEEIELVSRTYVNSEYTIFIKIGAPVSRQIETQDTATAYGQFSGTNLPKSELRYYAAYGREVSNPDIGTETGYLLEDPNSPGTTNPGIVKPIDVDVPVISVGKNQVFDKANPDNLTFTSTAPFNEFQAVKVDGVVIAASNYSVSEGSTIVTLFSSYISTLSNGTHTIAIVSNSGVAGTTFTVMNSNDVVVVCGHNSTKVIEGREATCVMRGYTGDTYCADCNVLISNGDYVEPTGHKAGDKIKENNVEPTCFSKGSYSMATYCKDCGIELSRENFTVLETTHQGATRNENVIDATCATIGSYEVVTYCRFCNVEMNREYRTIPTTAHIEATRTENTIASTCYSEGSYDLVTYCSECNSELNRINKPTLKANHTHATRTENEIAPTCAAPGSYDTVVYCSVCGYEISRTQQSVSKVDHTQATRTENEVASTCSTEGSYDDVTYCSVCNQELGRVKETIAKLDHTPATKTDKVVEKTCTTDGSYDTVTYCRVCGTELDRTTTTVAKTGHVATTTTENNILPTCSREGSYDTVTYCAVCNAELNRVTEPIAKLAHTTDTRKENEIIATCSAVGTYDVVTYCTVCGEEVSRRAQTTPKLDHASAAKTENNVDPTCLSSGSYDTVTYCKVCNIELDRVVIEVPMLAHIEATRTENDVAATCTSDGSYDTVTYCEACGTIIDRVTIAVPSTGHKNTALINASVLYTGDTYCNDCETVIGYGTATIEKKAALNDYTWAEIQILAQSDAVLSDYNIKIGDIKTDSAIDYRLVDDARDGYYGGLVFMFNKLESGKMTEDGYNHGGYAGSNAQSVVNAMYSKMPSSLQSVIKTVSIGCSSNFTNNYVMNYSSVKLFLPSVREVGYETLASADYPGEEFYDEFLNKECIPEGGTYEYKKAVFDWFAGSNAQSNRHAMCGYRYWWLRSVRTSSTGAFWIVYDSGKLGYHYAGSSELLIPAFVVG